MICSPQLKEHIRNSPSLSRTLEEMGCTYDRLKEKCDADQKFAVLVADNMGLLEDVIKRLKVDKADVLFPDNIPFIESGTSPEQALFNLSQVDWEAVHKTRTDIVLLNVVSKEYDNRSDLIEKKILFLSELLKDLKKDDALLRSHQIEISFLFACWLDDAAKFFDHSLCVLLGWESLAATDTRSRR
jgi:hypothetical protein